MIYPSGPSSSSSWLCNNVYAATVVDIVSSSSSLSLFVLFTIVLRYTTRMSVYCYCVKKELLATHSITPVVKKRIHFCRRRVSGGRGHNPPTQRIGTPIHRFYTTFYTQIRWKLGTWAREINPVKRTGKSERANILPTFFTVFRKSRETPGLKCFFRRYKMYLGSPYILCE